MTMDAPTFDEVPQLYIDPTVGSRVPRVNLVLRETFSDLIDYEIQQSNPSREKLSKECSGFRFGDSRLEGHKPGGANGEQVAEFVLSASSTRL
jgi:hypothetical protein